MTILSCAAGCGSVSGTPDARIVDSASALDASTDAADANAAACDLSKPFGPAAKVGGVNSTDYEVWGWLSGDQQTMYFAKVASGDNQKDLYVATRPQVTGDFSSVTLLGGVSTTTDNEERPALTADGLTMFLESANHIHIATRANTAADFSVHTPVAVINSGAIDWNPWIRGDGLTIYFTSNRNGNFDLFKATRVSTSSPFGTPVPVGELNSASDDYAPVLSDDGLEAFFGSWRDQSGPNPLQDMYHATRTTPNDGFGTPTPITELNDSSTDEFPNWISPDRCQLVFTSNREGDSGIWIATRPK